MLKPGLNVPDYDEEKLYVEAISNKNVKNREILGRIQSKIFRRYKEYYDNRYSLEDISNSNIYSLEEKNLLINCYTRKTSNLVGIVTDKIIASQNYPYVSNCPHCGFETPPRTIDHYLPKNIFPEFSILPINLIPMCMYCNNTKGEEWIYDGIRKCINFYFDKMTEYKILYGDLVKINNNYIVNFGVKKDNNISDNDYDIIVEHFNTYNLRERYTKASATIIAHIIFKIQSFKLHNDIHKKNLLMEIETNNTIYGVNYWKTCVYEAILDNENFWTSL